MALCAMRKIKQGKGQRVMGRGLFEFRRSGKASLAN